MNILHSLPLPIFSPLVKGGETHMTEKIQPESHNHNQQDEAARRAQIISGIDTLFENPQFQNQLRRELGILERLLRRRSHPKHKDQSSGS